MRKTAGQRCKGCQLATAFYCGSACQRSHWVVHVFDCNLRRAINSTDHLALAVRTGRMPEDPKTCDDFKFTRMALIVDKLRLFGLYMNLVDLQRVSPKEILLWSHSGNLVQEITAVFEILPDESHGPFYPWFLENRNLFGNPSMELATTAITNYRMRLALKYAGVPNWSTQAQAQAIVAAWPEKKQCCLTFFTGAITQFCPSPLRLLLVRFRLLPCCIQRNQINRHLHATAYKLHIRGILDRV